MMHCGTAGKILSGETWCDIKERIFGLILRIAGASVQYLLKWQWAGQRRSRRRYSWMEASPVGPGAYRQTTTPTSASRSTTAHQQDLAHNSLSPSPEHMAWPAADTRHHLTAPSANIHRQHCACSCAATHSPRAVITPSPACCCMSSASVDKCTAELTLLGRLLPRPLVVGVDGGTKEPP